MNFDRFTHKTQEALQYAQESARQHGHQGVAPAHVLLALLAQPEGVLPPLVEKAGGELHVLHRAWRVPSRCCLRCRVPPITST